jgi:hypothetical protein
VMAGPPRAARKCYHGRLSPPRRIRPRAASAGSVVDRGVATTERDAMRGLGEWGTPGLRSAVPVRPRPTPRLRLTLGLLLVGAAGCGAELSEDALHDALEGWFWREGIDVQGVSCPHGLARERDAAVDCRVTVGPEDVGVTVVVVDDDGALSVRPRHATVVAARAEPEIAETLRAQGLTISEVRCEGEVWVARPGAEQRCEVVDDVGRRFAWIGVWSGEGTRQRTRVVPLPPRTGGLP